MEALFWASVTFIAYVYVGYPVLLGVWSAIAARRARPSGAAGETLPHVSVIIAARNEAQRLPARIDNLLATDYPAGGCRSSSLPTARRTRRPTRWRRIGGAVALVTLPASGKAAALNAAVARAHAPHPRLRRRAAALRARCHPPPGLALRRSADRCRVGRAGPRLRGPGRSSIGEGVGAYWKYEKWLRRARGHRRLDARRHRRDLRDAACAVAAAAGRHAARRRARADAGRDARLSRAPRQPRRAPSTRGHEAASAELRRKVRTLAGNFQLLAQEPRLLRARHQPGLAAVHVAQGRRGCWCRTRW